MNLEQEPDFERFRLSRRRFLNRLAGFCGLAITAGLGASWSAEVGPVKMEAQPVDYPKPGWLETSLPDRPPFIVVDNGHKEYLRALCLGSPVLRDSLRRTYDRIFSGEYAVRPKVGDCLEDQMEDARLAITRVFGDSEPTTANIVHVAIATMAARFSPYITCQEAKDLGVAIPVSKSGGKCSILLHPVYESVLPYLFPVDPSTCHSAVDKRARCDGGDRTVHLSQHLFLSHQALYALCHNLPDIWRVPNGARLMVGLIRRDERKVKALDVLAQYVWEAEETRLFLTSGQSDYGRDEFGKKVPSGFADTNVDKDFRANNLGLSVGLALSNDKITNDDLGNAIVFLNNPGFYLVA